MRVIIFTSSTGDGHDAAAKALLASAPANVTAEIWQLEDFLAPHERLILVDSQKQVVRLMGGNVWRGIFNLFQTKAGANSLKYISRSCFFSIRKIAEKIIEFKPDIIISTNFYIPFFLKDIDFARIKITQVITDYGWHRTWYHPLVDHYFVGSVTNFRALTRLGVKDQNISFTGIPVKPIFAENYQPEAFALAHNLPAKNPVILILAGGQGNLPAEKYLSVLVPFLDQWSVAIVCGRNESRKETLELLVKEKKLNNVHVVGWTDNMADYIRAAAIVITKPGGLTTSECLTAQKPMILVHPIPGQEEMNAEYFVNLGYAVRARRPEEVIPAIQKFLARPPVWSIKKLPAATQIWQSLD